MEFTIAFHRYFVKISNYLFSLIVLPLKGIMTSSVVLIMLINNTV